MARQPIIMILIGTYKLLTLGIHLIPRNWLHNHMYSINQFTRDQYFYQIRNCIYKHIKKRNIIPVSPPAYIVVIRVGYSSFFVTEFLIINAFQQNHQSPLISTHWHIMLEIQNIAWDRNKHVVGLNRLMGSHSLKCIYY
jgi:hypothetical protein